MRSTTEVLAGGGWLINVTRPGLSDAEISLQTFQLLLSFRATDYIFFLSLKKQKTKTWSLTDNPFIYFFLNPAFQ